MSTVSHMVLPFFFNPKDNNIRMFDASQKKSASLIYRVTKKTMTTNSRTFTVSLMFLRERMS